MLIIGYLIIFTAILAAYGYYLNKRYQKKIGENVKIVKGVELQLVQMEKMVSLGKLASTVAHELNNPLEGVLTYAKLLKRTVKEGTLTSETATEIQSELSIIADETARCGNIVKNLLLFSREKIGEFVEEDIRIAIDRSLKLLDHHLQMHNIKLEKDFESERLMLFCDPQQIEQTLLAIEINAVEAMPDEGGLRVSAHRLAGSDSVQIIISDTGIGIPEEALPHIFEPFFTTKENGKGTGLGLAVVYGIIERHAGTINVQSRVHGGTSFTITLPRTNPETPQSASTTSLHY